MVWRTSRSMRAAWVCVALLIAAEAVRTLAGAPSIPSGTAGKVSAGLVLVAVTTGAWRLAFHPRLVLTNATVIVVNPIRTTVIPLDQIAPRVSCGYYGLTIKYLDGTSMRSVTAWAVQKANLSTWLHRHARADDAVRAIAEAARHSPVS